MANHKRRRPKAEQVVCFCKRHKLTANKKAGRAGGKAPSEPPRERIRRVLLKSVCFSPPAGPLVTDVRTGPTGAH